MTDIETLLVAILFFWMLWSFLTAAVIWMVRVSLNAIDRLHS